MYCTLSSCLRIVHCLSELLLRLSLEASGNFPWKLVMKLQHSLCFVLTRPGQTTGEAEADRWHHAGCRTADSGLGESPLWWWNHPCMPVWDGEGGNGVHTSPALPLKCCVIPLLSACECTHYMGVCYALAINVFYNTLTFCTTPHHMF